jgi:aspartate ammonia-lyase
MSRTEQDFLGQREIADDVYYGVQTIRGRENFHITGIPMSQEPYFVKALGYVKKAAAMANRDLGVLDAKIAEAIINACDRVISGEMMDQFVTDYIQGGAGTSTNMNANEVIANLALEALGHRKGEYQFVSPNDHVNYGQSTNDVYPTAFRLALILRLDSYITALRQLQDAFFAKGREFDRVLKMGRTHLQDAVPMSLGSEFRGWGTTMGEEVDRIYETRNLLREINLGATAIGTSVTAAAGYPKVAVRHLTTLTNVEFILASDLVEATSDTGAYVQLSGVLKRTAVKLTKICNDIRLLASGPRTGFQRDQPAAAAAGLLDHAGQGQSGDSGSGQPDELPRDRARHHGDAGGLRRPASAQRDGAGDLVRLVLLHQNDGARRQQPARELRRRNHRQ